jgi:methyl-accepting chemotaxis protein
MSAMTFKRFADWGWASKVAVVTLATAVPLALILYFYVMPTVEQWVYEEKAASVHQAVDIAYTLVAEYETRVGKGEFSRGEAQRRAMERIRNLRYNGTDYFWINDLTPRMIMHPLKPEMNGKDISAFTDPNGKAFFVEMADVCRRDGEGLVNYLWPKPGSDVPVPKFSAVILFKPWGWIIGTGVYVDDVESDLAGMRIMILSVISISLLVAGLAGLFLGRHLARSMRELTEAAGRLARGDAEVNIPVRSRDEIGKLSDSFNTMASNMRNQATIIDRIASGDLSAEAEVRSEQDIAGRALQRATASLRGLVAEAAMLSRSAVDGKLATRGNAEKFQGGYREIVQGVNATLDAVIGPLNVAAAYVDRISKGEIPAKITDTYHGDFNEVRINLNRAIDAVNALVADAQMLSRAAVEGRLATRADATAHNGDFRRVVEGVNATLDSLVGFIDTMPLPVMVIDRDRTVLYMNKLGASLGGRTARQLQGTKCFDHFRTEHCTSGECACLRAIQSGVTQEGETLAHPGDHALDIQYTGIPVRNERQEVVGALEIVVDQTAVRKAQRVLQKVAEYQQKQVDMLATDLQKLSVGDLTLALTVDEADEDTAKVKRDFGVINERLGVARHAVASLVADAVMLAHAAVDGQLAVRADVTRHQGDFRAIVQGVNETLDAVIRPVQESTGTLAVMAKGDLTARMQGDYKGDLRNLKESINAVGDSLEGALRKVSEAVSATASASSQISSSTEQMAAGAQEQTSQAGEVAAAVEQMTTTILENSRNANAAAETAKEARRSAEQGGAVVTESIGGMRRIADVVNRSAETVKQLGRSSDQIGEIIGVIDDIADQTNLLALNAAIEAARAGEQGRGFAVVADEVRKLAERTTKATKEIAGMIKTIQTDTAGAVQSMQDGTIEVERGIQLADKAGASLIGIVGVSQKVTDMVGQIAVASEEQSSSSEQISRNVEAISKVTGETAQGTQQIARAAEDLNRLTANLEKLIAGFTLGSTRQPEGWASGSHDVLGRTTEGLALANDIENA